MITRLKVAIDGSGYKQKWIAAKLGIRYDVLSRYVSGDREPPPKVVRELSKLLNLPQKELRGHIK